MLAMSRKIHWEVLSSKQKALLPKLKFLKEQGFYLADGTAIALQLGHRASLDFDFYTQLEFEADKLRETINKQLPQAKITVEQKHTLLGKINQSGLSLFYYPYPVIRPFVTIDDFLDLLSLEDLSAMKMLAIGDRGTRRDFIDIYCLIKLFGLEKILKFVEEKYPQFDSYHAFLALTYFKDAQAPEDRGYQILQDLPSWPEIKNFLIKKTAEYKTKLQ